MVQYHCNSHMNVSLNGVIVAKKFNRSPRVCNIIEMEVFSETHISELINLHSSVGGKDQ